MTDAARDLWGLTLGRPQIDPSQLAEAIEQQASGGHSLDFRTRVLIRDSVAALGSHWGPRRLDQWLAACKAREAIEAILRSDLGPPGFPTLASRIMEATKPGAVLQFLRELGGHLSRPARVCLGGSVSLIVAGFLTRRTEDINVVDEIPAEVRKRRDLLDRLAKRYGLRLAHVRSDYLPPEWPKRVGSLGRFGQLDVDLVDPYDVFLSKLFSGREKDLDDLRILAPEIDKAIVVERLRRDATPLTADPKLRQAAADNWYIVYGEPLPT